MNFAIIAAGEGSRLAQEGVMLPKPLVEIDGMPMIGRLIEVFSRSGARRIVVCINEYMTEVREYLSAYSRKMAAEEGTPRLIVKVKTTPSSMHTMAEIAGEMEGHGRWIATTVDTIFREKDFRRYVEAWENAPASTDVMMAVTDFVDDEKPLWVVSDPDTFRIEAFLDECPANPRYISGGIYGLSDPAVGVLRECLSEGVSRMRNYQRRLVDAGLDVRAFPMGKIIDVDHASDIATANDFIRE